jgi:hypothetical protein
MKTVRIAFISVIIAIGLLIASSQFGNNNFTARVVLAYSEVIFLFILLSSAVEPKSSFLMVVFSFYHCSMFLFPGMIHSAQGWFPFYDTSYNPEDIFDVSLLLAAYSTCTFLGYLFAGWLNARSPAAPSYNSRNISDLRIIIGFLVTIAVSTACIAVVGWQQFIARRGDLSLFGPEPDPLSMILVNVPRAATFCAAVIIAERVISRRNAIMFFSAIPTFVLAFILNNPLTLPRYYFFGLTLAVAYLLRIIVSPRSKLIFIAAATAGQILVFPLFSTLSRGGIGEEFHFDPIDYLSTHGDFDGLQSVLSTYLLVQKEGLSYGWHLLSSLLAFVPRGLWPTKAFATGQAAGEAMGFTFVNLSAPLPAEIYVDFGVGGLLVLPFLIGVVVTMLDRAAQRAALHGAPMTVRLFYGGLIGYAVILCRGSLLAVLAPIYIYFGVVAIWHQMSRPVDNPQRHPLPNFTSRREAAHDVVKALPVRSKRGAV